MYINKLLKKQLSLSAASLFLIVFVILGSSYALFENTQVDINNQSMSIGDLIVAFNNSNDQTLDDSDALNIDEMSPMSDEEGLSITDNIYTFTIKNTGTIAYTYTIAFADDPTYLSGGANYDASKVVISKTGDETITESERPTWRNIHMNLKGYKGMSSDSTSTIITKTPFENKTFNLGNDTINGIIYSSVVNPGESHSYKLQTWLNYDTTLPNKAIGAEIHLNILIEGEASDIGYRITNLLKNGDFSNGMSGWTSSGNFTTVINSTGGIDDSSYAKLSPITTFQYLHSSVTIPAEHKFYISGYYRKSGGSSRMYVYDLQNKVSLVGIELSNDASTWTKTSAYGTNSTSVASYSALIYGSGSSYSENMYTEWDNILVVDLTETFGSGNEPTKDWCDANIDWFEGSKVIYKY